MTDHLRFGDRELRLVQGDITRETTDAVVNAANEQLVLGGGVAGAIRRAGGPFIQEACHALAPIATGEAVITTGGQLPAKHVIHAVGPRGSGPEADRLLEAAVRSAFRVAEENGLRSLSLPAISTGIFGYPLHDCARIMTRVGAEWLRDPDHGLTTIRIVLFDREALQPFQQALETGVPETRTEDDG
jgi:O-acetyl-ADP-ribose deacetylase (regulator of RNase III)